MFVCSLTILPFLLNLIVLRESINVTFEDLIWITQISEVADKNSEHFSFCELFRCRSVAENVKTIVFVALEMDYKVGTRMCSLV
jgi:hypothetical protein